MLNAGCDDDCELLAVGIPGPPGPPGPPGGGSGGDTAQLVLTGTAGRTLSGHRAVYRRPDGLFDYADPTDPAHLAVPIGVTLGAASSGGAVTVLMLGELTEGSWSWTAPGSIFLGPAGTLTQTVPAAPGAEFLAVVGSAVSPTRMYVDRSPSIALAP